VEHFKSLLSRQEDASRLAYGRRRTNYPRQSVMMGTTNDVKPYATTPETAGSGR
jgi:predicted P-loop ATPase